MPFLHLDYETYSELPLGGKDGVGTHRYAHHESTEVTLAAFAVDHEPVQVLEGFNPRLPGPAWGRAHDHLARCLTEPAYEVVAFNAEFERLITAIVCGLPVHASRFICTMARAWSLSFVGGLGEVAKELGFPVDKQKLAEGRRLMQKFAKPRRASKHDPRTRWGPADTEEVKGDPEGWAKFREYAAQDVVVSREVLVWCDRYPWHPAERRMWTLDQEINDTGWPMDMRLVANANRVRLDQEAVLLGELKTLTGLANPNSRGQIMSWLAEQGCAMPDMQAGTVSDTLAALDVVDPHSPAVEALHLRQQLARATPKKWDAIARTAHEGRVCASLEFGAAQRTQRWGGRVLQPQNLYSEREYDTDELADVLTYADRRTVEALYGDVLRVLSGAIRPAITAPPGHKLVVCDLSSIESRLLGYHSGEERINGIFRRGEDTYKDLASRVFGVPVESVTKAQRTFAKPAELGCGYRLGGKGLVRYAADMGVAMTEDEAHRVVSVWRESNPAVVSMWRWFDDVVPEVVQRYAVFEGYGVRFRRDEHFLFIDLPSGRSIYYYSPLYAPLGSDVLAKLREAYPDRPAYDDRPQFQYMGRLQEEGGRWQRVHTHSGKVTENIIQAVARDVLRDALLSACRMLADVLTLVGHVHDEIVGTARDENADAALDALADIMSQTPIWAPGLLLDAEGFVTRRYRKG